MAMAGLPSGSLQATHSPGRLAGAEGRRPLGAIPYSPYEPGKLSKWLSHDDSTINIIIRIIIIIIVICSGNNTPVYGPLQKIYRWLSKPTHDKVLRHESQKFWPCNGGG